jgi:hypothetical protein
MKFKAIAVIATAAALGAGMAGSAAASPHRAAPQVTGVRLQTALLPPSAFGDGFKVLDRVNTGKKLWPTRVHIKPSTLSCAKFETYVFAGGFGNTAGAVNVMYNSDPAFADYPSLVLESAQSVMQFKTAQAAASYYNQAYARYRQCSYFTDPDPVFGTFELSTRSVSKTTVSKHNAIQVNQLVDVTQVPALSFYSNTAIVLAGTNVYTVEEVNGTNDPVPASLLSKFIGRVQGLYKHR